MGRLDLSISYSSDMTAIQSLFHRLILLRIEPSGINKTAGTDCQQCCFLNAAVCVHMYSLAGAIAHHQAALREHLAQELP